MKDIKLNLAKPYGRENETVLTMKLEFECLFNDQAKALKFHEKLNKLVQENLNGEA